MSHVLEHVVGLDKALFFPNVSLVVTDLHCIDLIWYFSWEQQNLNKKLLNSCQLVSVSETFETCDHVYAFFLKKVVLPPFFFYVFIFDHRLHWNAIRKTK